MAYLVVDMIVWNKYKYRRRGLHNTWWLTWLCVRGGVSREGGDLSEGKVTVPVKLKLKQEW